MLLLLLIVLVLTGSSFAVGPDLPIVERRSILRNPQSPDDLEKGPTCLKSCIRNCSNSQYINSCIHDCNCSCDSECKKFCRALELGPECLAKCGCFDKLYFVVSTGRFEKYPKRAQYPTAAKYPASKFYFPYKEYVEEDVIEVFEYTDDKGEEQAETKEE